MAVNVRLQLRSYSSTYINPINSTRQKESTRSKNQTPNFNFNFCPFHTGGFISVGILLLRTLFLALVLLVLLRGGGEGDHGKADVLRVAIHVVLTLLGSGLEETRGKQLIGYKRKSYVLAL